MKELRVTSDEGYVYVLLQTEGKGAPDWNRVLYRIAIDTYDPKRGERELPRPFVAGVATGAEFLVDIQGPGRSSISVTPSYNPYPGGTFNEGRPVASPSKPSGTFEALVLESNRERFGRDGRRFPREMVERGALRFVRPGEDSRRTLQADVAVGTDGAIELRLPWALLNVSDPSTHRVLDGVARSEDSETTETDGFRFYAYSFDARRPDDPPRDQLPGRWRNAPPYRWPAWDEPRYRLELKESASVIAETAKELTDVQTQ